jgi:beta-glucosidase
MVGALRGFNEAKLAVGASAMVTMSLSAREIRRSFLFLDEPLIDLVLVFNIWNVVSQVWVRPSGTFTVPVGASIKDIHLTGTF